MRVRAQQMNITVVEHDFCDDSSSESNNLSTSDPRRKHRKYYNF